MQIYKLMNMVHIAKIIVIALYNVMVQNNIFLIGIYVMDQLKMEIVGKKQNVLTALTKI